MLKKCVLSLGYCLLSVVLMSGGESEAQQDFRFEESEAFASRLSTIEADVDLLKQIVLQGETNEDDQEEGKFSHVSLSARITEARRKASDCIKKGKKPPGPVVKLSGFFQADAGFFHQDTNSVATLGRLQNGADFRRARLQALGNVADNISYSIEFDFGFPGRPSFMDVWMQVDKLPLLGNVRVGQYRQPFSMTAWDSIKQLTFLERPLPFLAFVPFRRLGVMSFDTNSDESMTWAFAVFRANADQYGNDIGNSGGFGGSARVTWLPMDFDEAHYMHLGLGYDYSAPGNNSAFFRTPPEFFLGSQLTAGFVGTSGLPTPGAIDGVPFFANTGPQMVQNFQLLGPEWAGSVGSFHYQTEAVLALVDQINGPTAYLPSAYAQAGIFLTGEHRPYNKQMGAFGTVEPRQPFVRCNSSGCCCGEGWGAWEVAGRWSYVDLNDKNIAGGRLTDYTFGLNWYLHTHAKFQFNYIHAELVHPTLGESHTNIFATRCHLDF